MRKVKFILAFFVLLSIGVEVQSNDGIFINSDFIFEAKFQSSDDRRSLELYNYINNQKNRKKAYQTAIGLSNQCLFDLDYALNLNSPTKRRNHQWEMQTDELMSEKEESVDLIEEYKSTIAKIKAAEEKQNIQVVEENAEYAWIEKISTDDYMEIFISGGGFKNGVDARLHDRIMINNAGYVESYYESEISGVKSTSKIVKKEELAALIKWIAEKGFFSFEKEYTCNEANIECAKRLERNPQPIPLKIVVAVGERRNVVVLPIFAPNIEKNYIEYPKELIQIVEAIYLFASL
jgi:hypothetical protein